MKLHLYMIAAAFGDPATNSLAQTVVGSWIAESPEVATAQFVSKWYFDGGARHALIGITALELAPDAMQQALATIEQPEQRPPKVVPLAVVQPPSDHAPIEQANAHTCIIHGQLRPGEDHCAQCRANMQAGQGGGPWSGLAFKPEPA